MSLFYNFVESTGCVVSSSIRDKMFTRSNPKEPFKNSWLEDILGLRYTEQDELKGHRDSAVEDSPREIVVWSEANREPLQTSDSVSCVTRYLLCIAGCVTFQWNFGTYLVMLLLMISKYIFRFLFIIVLFSWFVFLRDSSLKVVRNLFFNESQTD